MREMLRGVAIGLVLLALLGAIASRAGWLAIAVPRPDGAGAWLTARATGFVALAALGLEVIAGLLVATRSGGRWIARAQLIELHGWLSPIAVALVAGHALVLLADDYLRLDLLDVAIPLVSPYRPVAVGLGVIAAYCALVVHASFGLRRILGTKAWRRLHALSFVALGAGALHGVLAGSDARRAWAIALVAIPLSIAAALIAVRVARRRGPAAPRAAPGPGRPSPGAG